MGFWSFVLDDVNEKRNNNNAIHRYLGSIGFGNSGEQLTEDQVMSIPTAKTCCDIIIGSLKQLPVKLYKKDFKTGDYIEIKNDYRLNLLNCEPNDFTTSVEFKEQLFKDLLLHGNAYLEVVSDNDKIYELWNIASDYVQPIKYIDTESGYRVSDVEFDVITPTGRCKLAYDNVISCVLNSDDGVNGKGVIYFGNEIFKLALNELELSKNIMENGSSPAGILNFPTRLDDESAEHVKNSWKSLYGGSKNRGKTVILEEGVTYKPITLSPTELGLTTSRTTTGSEICRLFSVPEPLVDSTKVTSSVEAVNIRFVQNCISPLVAPVEIALTKGMLSEVERKQGLILKIDTSGVIKTTLKERYDAYIQGINGGILDINEVRRDDGRLPLEKRIQKMSLGDVLYFVDDDIIFNPNSSVSYNLKTGEFIDPKVELERIKDDVNQELKDEDKDKEEGEVNE